MKSLTGRKANQTVIGVNISTTTKTAKLGVRLWALAAQTLALAGLFNVTGFVLEVNA